MSKFQKLAALVVAAFLGSFGTIHGQTWTGTSGSNVSTTANWTGGTAPTHSSNSSLTFGSATNRSVDFDSGGWSVNSLTFSSAAGAFTLTDGGLTIGAGGIVNNSTNTQTINNQITVGATETWKAASGNIVIGGYVGGNGQSLTLAGAHNITFNDQLNGLGTLNVGTGASTDTGTVTFNGYTSATTINLNQAAGGAATFGSASSLTAGGGGINITGAGAVNLGGAINSGGITLNGTGTTTLSGSANKSTGAVVVNSGTLLLNQTGGGNAINNSLTVNSGGKVVMGANNQIPSWQTVTLNAGSTLSLNNTTQTITSLVITGDTTIDFGSGGSQLNVSAYNNGVTIANGATVTLVNWNSSMDTFTGSNPGNNVVNVQYADSNGNVYATGTWSGNTITPMTPVPESRVYGFIFIALGFSAVAGRRGLVWLRRLKAKRAMRSAEPVTQA